MTHSMRTYSWTEWLPLDGDKSVYQTIPVKLAGIYRIRARKERGYVYIGQTGRCLRERLSALKKGVYAEVMPFNDPHTAAPSLWVWRVEHNFEYEFTVLHCELDTPERQGLEDYFLWRHRQDFGVSTLCNYGRFHRFWFKSSNRKDGVVGGRLKNGNTNIAGVLSSKPLHPMGSSSDIGWMGLCWSDLVELNRANINKHRAEEGVYVIRDSVTLEVLYIGESQLITSRLTSHAKRKWATTPPFFSFCISMDCSEPHLRREIEVDLIGAYYEEHGRVPSGQYGRVFIQPIKD